MHCDAVASGGFIGGGGDEAVGKCCLAETRMRCYIFTKRRGILIGDACTYRFHVWTHSTQGRVVIEVLPTICRR